LLFEVDKVGSMGNYQLGVTVSWTHTTRSWWLGFNSQ